VVYASGEESAAQVKGRFARLGCALERIIFSGDTDADRVAASLLSIKPALAVIDSVQTLRAMDLPSDPGGVAQIRAVTAKFLEVAKNHGIIVILVGHITKDGQVAGPKTLEHMVDTVVHLESETAHDFRLLRATKNRFGSVNELGVFEMTGSGFREVKDASAVFLDAASPEFAGSAIGTALEGTRPFLVEVQTLVTRTVFGYPQRKASGYDLNRLQVLCSVMGKRAGANLSNSDVIANVVGGFRLADPALDLAVCLAAISGLTDISVSRRVVAIGEVGLGGEVRRVARLPERLSEAAKMGFEIALVPQVEKQSKIKQIPIRDLNALTDFLRKGLKA
jgi:DNA repair protein RadA/Sms